MTIKEIWKNSNRKFKALVIGLAACYVVVFFLGVKFGAFLRGLF